MSCGPNVSATGSEIIVSPLSDSVWGHSDMSLLQNGQFLVAWSGDAVNASVNQKDIWVQIYNSDGTVSSTFQANTTVVVGQLRPATTVLANGNFVVTWDDNSQTGGDTSTFAVRAQIFSPQGAMVGTEFLVNTTTFAAQGTPDVTALAGGKFVVTWTDSQIDGSGYGIVAQVFNADGSKSGLEFVVNSVTADDQTYSQIASLQSGGFVMAWTDASPNNTTFQDTDVKIRIFDDQGVAAGPEFSVTSAVTNGEGISSIAVLENGRFVVTWSDIREIAPSSFDQSLRAQLFEADGTLVGTEFLVNQTNTGQQYYSHVAALTDGRFVITWADRSGLGSDTSGYAVRAQVFSADGTMEGAELTVNTTTLYNQYPSDVIAFDDGGFAISFRDGSTNNTVRLQIFSPDAGGSFTQTTSSTAGVHLNWDDSLTITTTGDITATDEHAIEGCGTNTVVIDGHVEALSATTSVDGITLASSEILDTFDDNYVHVTATGSITALGGAAVRFASDDADGELFNEGVIRGLQSFVGADELELVQNSGAMYGDVVLNGGNDRYFGIGTGFVDGEILGGDGHDWIVGTLAQDNISGGNKSDRLRGNEGRDTLLGGKGNDDVKGGKGQDTLKGGKGADDLIGGKGQDKIYGGDGRDVITGSAGNDLMVGGAGQDDFVFAGVTHVDTITDFEDGVDQIDLSHFNLADLAALNAAGAISGSASQTQIDLAPIGGIGIVTLQGFDVANLTADDFVF